MAETHFLTHIHLNGSHIKAGGFESLAAAPTSPFTGQMYFNTVSSRLLYWDGTAWVDPASVASAITAIDTTTVGVTVDDSDKTAVTVDVASASATTPGLQSIRHYDALDGATADATGDMIALRDADGNIKLGTAIDAAHAVTKGYVDTLVSSGMTIKGATDCSTNPDYPAAIVGDTYHVTVGGTVGGVTGPAVEVGDIYICVTDTATGNHGAVGDDWVIVQRNDFYATTTAAGNVRLATAGEITTGTATDVAVTPADVTTILGSKGATFTQTLTAGATSYTVTHNLGGVVQVQVYNKTSGDYVITDVSRTDDNVVVIEVNAALAVDHAVTVTYGGTAPA